MKAFSILAFSFFAYLGIAWNIIIVQDTKKGE